MIDVDETWMTAARSAAHWAARWAARSSNKVFIPAHSLLAPSLSHLIELNLSIPVSVDRTHDFVDGGRLGVEVP